MISTANGGNNTIYLNRSHIYHWVIFKSTWRGTGDVTYMVTVALVTSVHGNTASSIKLFGISMSSYYYVMKIIMPSGTASPKLGSSGCVLYSIL